MYATIFFFGIDGAGIVSAMISVFGMFCGVKIGLFVFCRIVTFEMSNRILLASNAQLAELL